MTSRQDPFHAVNALDLHGGAQGRFYSLPALEKSGVGPISRLPVSIRIVLESALRNVDGARVTENDVRTLANYAAKKPADCEIPFVVARIVLQDFTGVPLLVDLAAMRSVVERMGKDPALIEPLVPVDLVVDHSVQVDFFGSPDALRRNLEMEFGRNRERYEFLKWGQQAFNGFHVVPPGIGIVHQVNLEYLAQGVLSSDGGEGKLLYPDTLVGTDSHTTMINGLGVVGWGVGGIEAEAGMLGQPVYFQTPEVIGVHLSGSLREGVTATDLTLHITQMLRAYKVVGKFVEFFGPGVRALPVADRAMIANMAPEYGATMGFFPIDEQNVKYLRSTGRSAAHCADYESYWRAQGMWGIPELGQVDYTDVLELNLAEAVPSVAGPKRPQDRIELPQLKETFRGLFSAPQADGGFNKNRAELERKVSIRVGGNGAAESGGGSQEARPDGTAGVRWSEAEMVNNRPTPEADPMEKTGGVTTRPVETEIGHGSVVIAAITSCTNTSNPNVMLGAGLVAKKAVERGLKRPPYVKTSLAPGSRVVSDYLQKTGLQKSLDALGFHVVGFGCTTCIGNSGPLPEAVESAIVDHNLITASVLSGNRNFEARIHSNVKANFLMSPPLVVAFALAGRIDIDLANEPLGRDKDGKDVYLRDLWPTPAEIEELAGAAVRPEVFNELYKNFEKQNPAWAGIAAPAGRTYAWDEQSTYIQEPPFFDDFAMEPAPVREIQGARALGVFGDSVTTDHISPAGSIKADSPAGKYLVEHGVSPRDFNSFGSRRGNDRVMTRGTFGNVRIKNLMLKDEQGNAPEGGLTKCFANGALEQTTIFDAAMKYAERGTPLVVFAGAEYGTGSSRDWAAKGTNLLGVRAVIAVSYERIHRSNLIGMGVLPLQFEDGTNAGTLGIVGDEMFDLIGVSDDMKPGQTLTLAIHRANGRTDEAPVKARLDTAIEVEYFRHGGILPYVLRQLLK